MSIKQSYIWQLPDWPNWRYDLKRLAPSLAQVSLTQGMLLGRLADIGFDLREQAQLTALTEDVVNSSDIEGERLNADSVRSSIARRLGIDIGALAPVDRHVEGVVEMILDATSHCNTPITLERILGWHAALFPTGYSGMSKIRIAALRDDTNGSMQVVSGPYGRQRIHYEAPPAERLDEEIRQFIAWFEESTDHAPLIKAGLAHLWLVTLHPFDDGNGRIARAVGDMLLARADGSPQRFYSLSAQIQRERKAYYDILERTQKGPIDVTEWLAWFLEMLQRAVENAQTNLDVVLIKTRFWHHHADLPFNERQIQLINRLLDGFTGKLTAKKWATLAKCSSDTALRDINMLITHGILRKSSSGGRSTSYELCVRS